MRERLKRLRELGKKQNVQYQLDRALEINTLSQENINAYKRMVNTEGWQILSERLRQDARDKQVKAMSLSVDPERNKTALIVNYAVGETITRILNHVEGVLNREEPLRMEREELDAQASE